MAAALPAAAFALMSARLSVSKIFLEVSRMAVIAARILWFAQITVEIPAARKTDEGVE